MPPRSDEPFLTGTVDVGPAVEDAHLEVISERGETVDNVRAEVGVDVLRRVLADPGTVHGPVGEVADHYVLAL